MRSLESLIRAVPDFPSPGILFRDITPLLADPGALRETLQRLADPFRDRGVTLVAAVESRGFILGSALALELDAGFVPIRKLGKLPGPTRTREYALEYGCGHLEIQWDAVRPADRVLLVDDVLATGGTARAAAELVEESGSELVAIAVLIELDTLGGRAALGGRPLLSLLRF